MIKTLPILKDGLLALEPFTVTDKSQMDYFCDIVARYTYNTIKTKEAMIDLIDKYAKEMWLVRAKDMAGGVIFLMQFNGEWSFDAYADMEVGRAVDKHGDLSYRSARLVLDYFFENSGCHEIITRHDYRNKGASLLCRRLGFKDIGTIEIKDIGKLICLKLNKDAWELKRRSN